MNEVSRQAEPFKYSWLEGGILIKVEEPAALRKAILMADEGPVAVGEIPALAGAQTLVRSSQWI